MLTGRYRMPATRGPATPHPTSSRRQVHKRYRAIVAGRLDPPAPGGAGSSGAAAAGAAEAGPCSLGTETGGGGGAAADLEPCGGGGGAVPIVVEAPIEGRAACTEVLIAGHSRCLRYGGWVTTVDLRPLTGRRHQLRRHMALCLGHPILGDPLYTPWAGAALAVGGGAAGALLAAAPDELRARAAAAGGSDGDSPGSSGADDAGGGGAAAGDAAGGDQYELLKGWGMALWAGELEFEHPVTGERMRWSLPEPPRFGKLRAQQAARWRKFYGGGAAAV